MKYLKPSFLLLFFLQSLFVVSCTEAQSIRKVDPLPQALLWKIEHKDLPEPSYLFGTIHMIPKDDFFLPAGFEDAFAKTDQVVFEINMDDMSGIGTLMGMISNLLMKDGMTLDRLISEEEYREVSVYFEEMGLPMFMLNKVKPMFLSMLAEINMDPAAIQDEGIISYEQELYQMAQESGKVVGGLETMNYQMSLFDSIPYKDQAVMLVESVRGVSDEDGMIDETINLYKTQHIEGMLGMVSQIDSSGSSSFERMLLHNRNKHWIPVMQDMMKEGPVFFAVGAGHLAGEVGVIKLLQEQGYKITPVSVHKTSPASKTGAKKQKV